MRAVLSATSKQPPNAIREIDAGQRPRIDYLALSSYLPATYMDYSTTALRHGTARRVEETLRLDIYLAMLVARDAHARDDQVVLSMSERVGIPLGYWLDRRIKHAVMMHHPMSPTKLRLLKAFQTPRRWDLLIALSNAEATALQDILGLAPNQIITLHAPIDTDYYNPNIDVEPMSESDHVLSLGLAQRDYPTLIQALRGLPHVTCHISATSAWTSHRAGYEQEIIPSNVLLKSYDHPNIIRERYLKSRFTIIPMRHHTTQWSAGSTSVLQPQAMGKAVIATRTPGLVEYVRDGETGILVEGGNPQALAEAIDYLWKNPEKAAAMGQRAREWVAATFSLDRWMDEIGSALNGLVDSHITRIESHQRPFGVPSAKIFGENDEIFPSCR
jgi:glycosyltransferase involved in cell wall biosynthesis